jgi:sugar phosphate isomerase/epimerase
VPKVSDLATAAAVVAEANQPNGGLLIDLYHFYRGTSRLEDVWEVPVDRVFLVHLDDAMPLPRETLIGMKHRRLPGEGVAPVREVLAVLIARGATPQYAVEVFSEEFWSLEPTEAATRAYSTARRVLDEAAGANAARKAYQEETL